MARVFVFADEAGDFNFSRHHRASKYFIVCTVTMTACDIAHDLLALRRELAWHKKPVGDYFHATEDKQEVRDAVFQVLRRHPFHIHAQIMEKSKAQPQIRSSDARFYQHGWFYVLRFGTSNHIPAGSELLVTAASVQTKRKQAAFTAAVNDVVQQTIRGTRWATHFCPCAVDPCLQVADYCTWAIQRKWERNETRSYDLIKDRIRYEYDLWSHGQTHYY
jgi:hypothetical protein